MRFLDDNYVPAQKRVRLPVVVRPFPVRRIDRESVAAGNGVMVVRLAQGEAGEQICHVCVQDDRVFA